MESESKKQRKLIIEYEKQGYYVIKLIQTNKNGIPDLLIIKDGIAEFIEVKKDNNTEPEPLQLFRKKELIKAGCKVRCI